MCAGRAMGGSENSSKHGEETMIGLQARVELAKSRVFEGIEGLENQAFGAWATALDLAWQDGRLLGQVNERPDIPQLIDEEPDLKTAFVDGVSRGHADREEQRRIAEEKERAQRTECLIREGRWSDLDLPAPHELAARVLKGESPKIRQHSLYYEDGFTWYTNPYGVDGVLGAKPDTDLMARFLISMARGVELGAVPY